MSYISTKEASELWGVTERTVRKYCEQGKIPGVIHAGTVWVIPMATLNPHENKCLKTDAPPLVKKILAQRKKNNHQDIYEYIQVHTAYCSSRIASNRLTETQVLQLYRTGKISSQSEPLKFDDIVEINNHFLACGYMLDTVMSPISSAYISILHQKLFSGTKGNLMGTLHIGEYRKTDEVGYSKAAKISAEVDRLIKKYEGKKNITLNDILDFHAQFELIHPYEDGNERVGRMLMVKECLRHSIDPIIIDDKHRAQYHSGIREWKNNPSIFLDVAEKVQERFRREKAECDQKEFYRPETGRGSRPAK